MFLYTINACVYALSISIDALSIDNRRQDHCESDRSLVGSVYMCATCDLSEKGY